MYFSMGPPAASLGLTPKSVARLRSAMTRSLTMSQVQVATSLANRTDSRRCLASRRSFSVRVRGRAVLRDGLRLLLRREVFWRMDPESVGKQEYISFVSPALRRRMAQ